MVVVTQHDLCIDPLAKVGQQIGSEAEKRHACREHQQHSQSEPVEGRFASIDEHEVDEDLDEESRGEAKDRHQDCRQKRIQENLAMVPEQRPELGERRFRQSLKIRCRPKKNQDAGPVFLEFGYRQLAQAERGVSDRDTASGPFVDHDEVISPVLGPMRNGRELYLVEPVHVGPDPPRRTPDLLRRLDESGQIGPLPVRPRHFPQPRNRLPFTIVSRHHRQASRPAIVRVMVMDNRITHTS